MERTNLAPVVIIPDVSHGNSEGVAVDVLQTASPLMQHTRLDVSVARVCFLAHPLATTEHIVAAELAELCEQYDTRTRDNFAAFVVEG